MMQLIIVVALLLSYIGFRTSLFQNLREKSKKKSLAKIEDHFSGLKQIVNITEVRKISDTPFSEYSFRYSLSFMSGLQHIFYWNVSVEKENEISIVWIETEYWFSSLFSFKTLEA